MSTSPVCQVRSTTAVRDGENIVVDARLDAGVYFRLVFDPIRMAVLIGQLDAAINSEKEEAR